MINGIILNIIAYFFMCIGAYYALDFSIKQGNKVTRIINFCILFWNIFMVFYLVLDYDKILQSPLNERLNFFETITNFLLAFWLISFKLRKNEKFF
jgi:hypothetical protein